ncbi:MAG: T9SS type A sorting domain-containing protein [Crocinitomix sp.]|nr:T9SS type A sorting domain-containing protein [Crocinitomix sp.]
MKTLFTLLFAATLVPFTGVSQNFDFVSGNLVEKTITIEEFENGESKILNSSDEAVVFEWEMITFDQPATWDFSICDYTVCYTEGETTGTMTTVDGGSESAFLRVNVLADIAGVGTYEFVVWDQAMPDDTDTLTIVLTAEGSASINEALTADKLTVTAPINDQMFISNKSGEMATYTVMNISGQVLANGFVGPHENITIQTGTYNTGLYFFSFQNRGQILKTEKIVIR